MGVDIDKSRYDPFLPIILLCLSLPIRMDSFDLLFIDLQLSLCKLPPVGCLLYTSDAADDLIGVDLGGLWIMKKKKG